MTKTAALIWTAILGTTAIFGTWFFACVFPFAAMATIAAITLDFRRGLALVAATWFANQLVGFGLMHYPREFDTFALGVSLGLGALAAFVAARAIYARMGSVAGAAVALGGAFVAYQIVIYVGALGFGGAGNFTPSILAGVALNDAIWFVVLAALYLGLSRLLPRRRSLLPV